MSIVQLIIFISSFQVFPMINYNFLPILSYKEPIWIQLTAVFPLCLEKENEVLWCVCVCVCVCVSACISSVFSPLLSGIAILFGLLATGWTQGQSKVLNIHDKPG